MTIRLFYKDVFKGVIEFSNIKGFRAGISVITVFDSEDKEHIFDLSEFDEVTINDLPVNK